MPCLCRIYERLDLLLMRHVGIATIEDQHSAMQALVNDPMFHFGMRLLVDTSELRSTDVDFSALLTRRDRHRQQLQSLRRPTRWSYYAPGELSYGLCRRAQIAFDDLPNLTIGVFRTPAETVRFLDLAPDALPDWPVAP